MGPSYQDPMVADSADPGAQCSDEQPIPPGAWNVKQGLFPGVADWSSGLEDPRWTGWPKAAIRCTGGCAHRLLFGLVA